MSKPRGPISLIRSNRVSIGELAVVALVLALSVNLVTSYIADHLSPWLLLLVSIVGFGIVFLYLILRYGRSKNSNHLFEALLVIDTETGNPIRVEGYSFGQDFSSVTRAIFSENPALAKQWHGDPLSNSISVDPETGIPTMRRTSAAKVVDEVTEYIFLETLSTHLTDYFNRSILVSHELSTFMRDDVPAVVLSNRVLDILSRDPADRDIFGADQKASENVVAIYGADAIFSRFDLTLPKGGGIARLQDRALQVSARGLTVTARVPFRAMGFHVGEDFEELYLGRTLSEVRCYSVPIEISVRTSSLLALFGRRWANYLWVESFLETCAADFHFEKFRERIDWPVVGAVVHALRMKDTDGSSARERSISTNAAASTADVDDSGSETDS